MPQKNNHERPISQDAHNKNEEEQDRDEIGLRSLAIRNVILGLSRKVLVCFVGVVARKYVIVQHEGVILGDGEIHLWR